MSPLSAAFTIHSKRLIGATIPGPNTPSYPALSITDSVLTNCDFSKVNQRVIVDDSIFIHCDFSGAVFTETTIKKATFHNCNFAKLKCVDALFFDVNLAGCTFPGADFSHTSFKKFTCDNAEGDWSDTLLWGVIGLNSLPACYSDAIKWIPGPPSSLYHADSNALGLARAWLRALSETSQVPTPNLVALYNEHPELTPHAFAQLASILKARS